MKGAGRSGEEHGRVKNEEEWGGVEEQGGEGRRGRKGSWVKDYGALPASNQVHSSENPWE